MCACGIPPDRPNVALSPAPAYLAGLRVHLPEIEGSDDALTMLHEKVAVALASAGYRVVTDAGERDLALSLRATVEEMKMPFEITKDGVKQVYLQVTLVASIDVRGKILDTKTFTMTMTNRQIAEQHGFRVVNEMTDSMPLRRWALDRSKDAEPTTTAGSPATDSPAADATAAASAAP
jgi:hypothetical protein